MLAVITLSIRIILRMRIYSRYSVFVHIKTVTVISYVRRRQHTSRTYSSNRSGSNRTIHDHYLIVSGTHDHQTVNSLYSSNRVSTNPNYHISVCSDMKCIQQVYVFRARIARPGNLHYIGSTIALKLIFISLLDFRFAIASFSNNFQRNTCIVINSYQFRRNEQWYRQKPKITLNVFPK